MYMMWNRNVKEYAIWFCKLIKNANFKKVVWLEDNLKPPYGYMYLTIILSLRFNYNLQ